MHRVIPLFVANETRRDERKQADGGKRKKGEERRCLAELGGHRSKSSGNSAEYVGAEIKAANRFGKQGGRRWFWSHSAGVAREFTRVNVWV